MITKSDSFSSKTTSILIVYATREGQTEKIAKWIDDHFTARGVRTCLRNAASPIEEEIREFDAVLLGGSMHAGGIEKELVQFVTEHQQTITSKPNAFFLVLLSAATKDQKLREQWLDDAHHKLDEQMPIAFQHLEYIAGALMYSKYPLPLKWVMRRIAKQAGEGTDIHKDYEYTDWKKVEAFADETLARFTAVSGAS